MRQSQHQLQRELTFRQLLSSPCPPPIPEILLIHQHSQRLLLCLGTGCQHTPSLGVHSLVLMENTPQDIIRGPPLLILFFSWLQLSP